MMILLFARVLGWFPPSGFADPAVSLWPALTHVYRTAEIVAAKLREFGCDEVAEGIGRTGVVGLIRGRSDSGGRVVGIRAESPR
jgi:hypothetical protein